MVVTELLVKNFPYIFETGYTAQLEGELDAVEEGSEKWTDLLKGFYGHFEKELKVARPRWKTSSGWSRRRRRSATSAAVLWCSSGASSELLLVLELHEDQAHYGSAGSVQERPQAAVKKVLDTFSFRCTSRR